VMEVTMLPKSSVIGINRPVAVTYCIPITCHINCFSKVY
jgi:hypothetical protein